MAHINDVARYILERQGGEVSTMKLQKLVYYAQAWSLVWDERPLFNARIEAWANGPVTRELYDRHRGQFTANVDMFPGDSERLNESERETVDVVLEAYGQLSGQQLSDLAHSERPWREAREGVEDGAASRNEVSPEVMQDFYSALQSASAV
ncbi:Panacea domain-containing protein [Corynebacterium lizhenjunii]|uniref:Panacea domain-containing protein n=1 Tax=Corynebacterium lizhenjunii TaxID=2709394 RepID=UPI0013EAED73|nr:type II toxin-antitoxin system antitoxin SocA domain-containing protein [Corynebacterium lizhenjunii]